MKNRTAKIFVRVWAIFNFLGAIMLLYQGPWLIMNGVGELTYRDVGWAINLIEPFPFEMGVLFILLGLFSIAVTAGLWMHKDWARITLVVFGVLGIPDFPVGTIYGGLTIWMFGFQKDILKLFRRKGGKRL